MNQLFDTPNNQCGAAYGISEANRLANFYVAQLAIQLGIIEKYQCSSNPEHVRATKSAWFNVCRYDAKLRELEGVA